MGGENKKSDHTDPGASGSSPRGRGKRTGGSSTATPTRLIPAWAGKTARLLRASVRGPGSSPRGRGKPGALPAHCHGIGLIPAWAGKTGWSSHRWGAWSAHPRVGGENPASTLGVSMGAGSSPRGRGKPRERDACFVGLGLIPAWAGKTFAPTPKSIHGEAHPRVGGENEIARAEDVNANGSSPRGRGKPVMSTTDSAVTGLIPAWAGKTSSALRRPRPSPAHPRVGGENVAVRADSRWSSGSSPRGRGKRLGGRFRVLAGGLIPAWAGKTTRGFLPPRNTPAHPRVGGENR